MAYSWLLLPPAVLALAPAVHPALGLPQVLLPLLSQQLVVAVSVSSGGWLL